MTDYTGPATDLLPNGQPVEKVVREYDGTLDVHSIFYTIQGEGPFCGVPAVFVRLAGCNLQCPQCDTEYTKGRKRMSVSAIVEAVRKLQPVTRTLVVITGGEPFRQHIGDLMVYLVACRYFVQVETNGTVAVPNIMLYNQNPAQRSGVYVVCSPKTGKVHPSVQEACCCYKYVLTLDDYHRQDGLPLRALGHVANPHLARPPLGSNKPVYLQPADTKNPEHDAQTMRQAAQLAMKHGFTVQLQIHKMLGLD